MDSDDDNPRQEVQGQREVCAVVFSSYKKVSVCVCTWQSDCEIIDEEFNDVQVVSFSFVFRGCGKQLETVVVN